MDDKNTDMECCAVQIGDRDLQKIRYKNSGGLEVAMKN